MVALEKATDRAEAAGRAALALTGKEPESEHSLLDRFSSASGIGQKADGVLSVLSVLSEGYMEKNALLSVLSERPIKKHFRLLSVMSVL